ncbi:MAG: S8 family serine peptidase [Gemmatimonadetes bacterium]|nr:S8 family serine peptidase [Gemmatimonadota bacterium]
MVSRLSAPAGTRIAVALEATPAGGVLLSGLQGELQFDPAALRYVGQAGYDSLRFPLVIVNDRAADAGTLVVLSVDPSGLGPQTAILAFDVLRGDYATSLRYRTDMAVTTALAVLPDGGTSGEVGEDAALRLPTAPVRLGPAQWTRLQRPGALLGRLIDSIPAGRRFGDVTGNGAVDVVDASRVGNWAVGNPSPAGTPIPAPGDLAELVGNVAPFNSPGLGETSDTKGPGWDANCVRLWDVLDAANISNEAVGNDKPVVGEVVPGDGVDAATGLPRRGTACVVSDTTRPAIVNGSERQTSPGPTVTDPTDPRWAYDRRSFSVRFDDSTSGPTIWGFLTRFRAHIVGGSSRPGTQGLNRYHIVIADPGPSWGAYDSLYHAMRASPGVDFVLPGPSGTWVQVRGRYPIDQHLASDRTQWFGTSRNTQPWLAIRAPLAWGCETGRYGGVPPRVGIVDNFLDALPSDLPQSQSPVPFVDSLLVGNDLSYRTPAQKSHGPRVASLVTAVGDNGGGIAGAIWNSDLRLYPLQRDTLSPDPYSVSDRIQDLFIHAGAPVSGSQVLNLSVGFLNGDRNDHVTFLREVIKGQFLDRNPGGLIVSAVGDAVTGAPVTPFVAQLADTNYRDPAFLAGITALDRALAQLYLAGDSNRIVFVTGSNRASQKFAPSNFWQGASLIAAPSDGVLGLNPDGTASEGSGTSYAAAFVSGVAAQLFAMDPTLTPAQVKDYILRGAQEPKFDPFTGQFIADSTQLRLPGAPGPVYQLDAYGSLTLLSRERAGVPVCGYEVAVGSQPTWEVKLARKEADTLRIPIPGGEAQGVSVAQGGRRLAVRVFNLATGVSTSVYSHTGALLHTAPGVERQFLERDTADISGTGVTITGPSGSMTYPNVFDLVDGGHLLFAPGRVRVAPDGMHALVESYADDDLGYQCPDGTDALRRVDRVHAVPLGSTGPAIPLLDTDVGLYCPGIDPGEYTGGLYFTWSQDGLRALANRWSHFYNPLDPNGTVTGESSLVREWTVGGMVASHTIAQRGLKYPRYTSDGFAWRFSEFSVIGAAPSCWTTTRQRANPGSPMLEAGAPTGADCFLADFEQTGTPLMPNLRARRNRAGARAARPN